MATKRVSVTQLYVTCKETFASIFTDLILYNQYSNNKGMEWNIRKSRGTVSVRVTMLIMGVGSKTRGINRESKSVQVHKLQ